MADRKEVPRRTLHRDAGGVQTGEGSAHLRNEAERLRNVTYPDAEMAERSRVGYILDRERRSRDGARFSPEFRDLSPEPSQKPMPGIARLEIHEGASGLTKLERVHQVSQSPLALVRLTRKRSRRR
jgi:hypothetical protein